MKDLSVKLPKVQQQLENELQRSPTIHEIAEQLQVSDETVIEAMESGRAYSAYSLQQSLENDSDSEGGSFLERYTGEEDASFGTVENADFLKRAMDSFTPEERKFCTMRFIEGMTQQKIAEKLGVSQMTVSRTEKKIKARFKEEFTR